MKRHGRRFARAALATTALGAVLLAAEPALRHLDLPRFDACSATADFAVPDPELGFAGPPGGVVAGEPLNALGLRGPILAEPKPKGHFRILFIGDSTSWGLGVPLEASFPAVATRLLGAEQSTREFEFLIGAFPGYSSYHSKIQLARLLPTSPDLVVFYVGARNDSTRHRYFRDADIPERRSRLAAGWHQVRLLRLAESLWDRLYKSVIRKTLDYESRARVSPDAFRTNVGEMAQRLRHAGIPSVIIVPPISEKLLQREPIAAQYREILREQALAYAIPTVSLEEPFDAGDPEELYFDDGYHFTAAGHALAAGGIRDAALANRLTSR